MSSNMQSNNNVNAGRDVKFSNKKITKISIGKLIIIPVLIVVLVAAGVFVFGQPPEKKIIGLWTKEGEEGTIQFFKDGTCVIDEGYSDTRSGTFKYYVDGNILKLTDIWQDADIYNFEIATGKLYVWYAKEGNKAEATVYVK